MYEFLTDTGQRIDMRKFSFLRVIPKFTKKQELSETGSWTLQRGDDVAFSSIAADQGIEQTVNRDTKTAGGLTGITLNGGMYENLYHSITANTVILLC